MKSFFFTFSQIVLTLGLYVCGAFVIAAALLPSAVLIASVWQHSAGSDALLRIFLMCLAVAGGYFLFGVALIFVIGILRMALRVRL